MWLLEGFGDDVARGEVEVLAVPRPRGAREGGNHGAHGLFPDVALLAHARPEGVQLHWPLTLAEPQLDAASAQEVEGGHALGHPDRMVGGKLDDPMPQADAARALG